jgi:hypothetical protein
LVAWAASSSERARISSRPQDACRDERAVELQVAVAVDLLLTVERVVAQRAVDGGQRDVAERVDEALVDLVRVLT